MKPTITEEDFRKALADQFKHAPDGAMTSGEIAAHIGVGVGTAMARVRSMMAVGTLEYAGRVRRQKITGDAALVPAYRMVKKGGKK